MAGIYWLASYPKSGNTWFRAFLTNLLQPGQTPASINQLLGGFGTSRALFEQMTGLDSADLTVVEIDRLRPKVYEQLAHEANDPIFLKIHDAYTHNDRAQPLIPTQVTLGVIYLIRNPLDVAVSFAHHAACDVNTMVAAMANENYALCGQTHRLSSQLRQKLLSWSSHVTSWTETWTETSGLPVQVLRYEDLVQCPLATFKQAVRFAALPHGDTQIQQAIDFSSFRQLKRQEQAQGFEEKAPRSPSFFRQGQVGDGQRLLSQSQTRQVVADHGPIMAKFGYSKPVSVSFREVGELKDAGSTPKASLQYKTSTTEIGQN